MTEYGEAHKAESAAAYSAAADSFDDPVLSLWDRSAAVGRTGHVLGLDIAVPALIRARAKAAARINHGVTAHYRLIGVHQAEKGPQPWARNDNDT